MSTLAWLDWRLATNRVRSLVRTPRRLVPWVFVVLMMGGGFVSRVLGSSGGRVGSILPVVAPYLPGAAALLLGYFFWYATRSAPIAFQSRADARFLLSGDLPPRLMVGWLTVRGSRRLIFFALFYLVVFGAYIPSAGIGWHVGVGLGVGVCCYAVLLIAASLLAFSVHLRAPRVPLGWIGIVFAALGAVAVAARVLPPLAPLRNPLTMLPPGSWLMAAAGGDLAPVPLLAAVTAAVLVLGLALIGECQPELYAASLRYFERKERAQQGMIGVRRARAGRATTARSAGAAELPPGIAIFFWKEWVTIRRGAGSGMLEILAVPVALVAGVVVGVLFRGPVWPMYMVLGYAIWFFALFTTFASVRLAIDLRMPIWWLSADPLWRRFAALTLARALRWGIAMALGVLATLAAGGQPPWAAVGLAVMVVPLSWLLQSLSLAVYSLLPATADRRAAQMLRVFSIMGALALIAAGAVPGIVAGVWPLALVGGLVVLCAELLGLVAFASWRIEGNGLAFASEETR
jgi:hypothetical protein